MLIAYVVLLLIILGILWATLRAYPQYEFAIIVLGLIIFCHGVLVAAHIRW